MPPPPDFEPVIQHLLRDMQREPPPFDRRMYEARSRALHALVVAYVTNVLCGWDVFQTAGERHQVHELIERLGIAGRHDKLLRRWLMMLRDECLLVSAGDAFQSAEPLRHEPTDGLLEAALKQWPEAPELVECLRGCGDNLKAILTGEKGALEYIFPAGSFRVAEAIYERSAPWRYCNDLLAAALRVIAGGWDQPRPLRILEVGGGVGGTTKSLLPVLRDGAAAYVFTDVSKLFLARASRKFAEYGFVERQILDLEKDPDAQGFPPRSFDVVVAANVLHATTDIESTVQRVHALLRPSGFLLLMELTENQSWLDMTFALLDGWGRHADRIRTDRPTLTIPQWQSLLEATGFSGVAHFPGDPADARAISNTTFVAGARPSNAAAE
jgi:SAM-dependent methyltransferase